MMERKKDPPGGVIRWAGQCPKTAGRTNMDKHTPNHDPVQVTVNRQEEAHRRRYREQLLGRAAGLYTDGVLCALQRFLRQRTVANGGTL